LRCCFTSGRFGGSVTADVTLHGVLFAGQRSSAFFFRWTGSDAEDVEIVDYH
jgi:hypothetical protein